MKQLKNELYDYRKEKEKGFLFSLRNVAWFLYSYLNSKKEDPTNELSKVSIILFLSIIAIILYGLNTIK